MKVYLDDERATPDGWVRAYWPDEVIELLKGGEVTELSLDHDLGDDERGTGYTVLLWLEEEVALHGMSPPKIYVHSANASAKQKIVLKLCIRFRRNSGSVWFAHSKMASRSKPNSSNSVSTWQLANVSEVKTDFLRSECMRVPQAKGIPFARMVTL